MFGRLLDPKGQPTKFEAAAYLFDFFVDLDGDGSICEEDLVNADLATVLFQLSKSGKNYIENVRDKHAFIRRTWQDKCIKYQG